MQAGGNRVERILSRTVGGRVILDLDIVKMVRSDPKRKAAVIDAGTPMVRHVDALARVCSIVEVRLYLSSRRTVRSRPPLRVCCFWEC